MITKWERNNVNGFAKEAEQTLKALAEKHGVSVRVKGGTFSPLSFRQTFEFVASQTDEKTGQTLTPETESFMHNCVFLGLTEQDLWQKFIYRNEVYRLIGLNPRRGKYPLSIERLADGKKFRFPVDAYKSAPKA